MEEEAHKPHIFVFPYMAQGHIIPSVDIAKLFASRNLKITIITTPLNEPLVSKQIERTKNLVSDINVQILQFPVIKAGLPEECENLEFITANNLGWEFIDKFCFAVTLLQEPLEKLLREILPDCLVADFFFPWATDSASKFGIPRLVFHGQGYFALCASTYIEKYQPYKKVSSDSESFIIPDLPGEIKLTGKQVPSFMRMGSETEIIKKLFKSSRESELKSFGVLVNSFFELEPAYAGHYRDVLGRKAWHIGPVSLCNRDAEDKARRGKEASICEHECLKWLNSKEPNSVVYICFGTSTNFKASQLKEIAIGLESSGQQFIWVVRRNQNSEEENEDWLPEGFKERTEGKGLIIQGWAPQLLILDHGAIGGFVTHCGWNSTIEGIAAGKPMVSWPVASEQFLNEKLVTDVLKIGVNVGVDEWTLYGNNIIKSESIEKAVKKIMEGEEAEEMRKKAEALMQMARKAVEEGGSSYSDLNALIDELNLIPN